MQDKELHGLMRHSQLSEGYTDHDIFGLIRVNLGGYSECDLPLIEPLKQK